MVTEWADYNLVVRCPSLAKRCEPWAMCWVEIIPRRGGEAGFELGTGMQIAPWSPEQTARLLRDAKV